MGDEIQVGVVLPPLLPITVEGQGTVIQPWEKEKRIESVKGK